MKKKLSALYWLVPILNGVTVVLVLGGVLTNYRIQTNIRKEVDRNQLSPAWRDAVEEVAKTVVRDTCQRFDLGMNRIPSPAHDTYLEKARSKCAKGCFAWWQKNGVSYHYRSTETYRWDFADALWYVSDEGECTYRKANERFPDYDKGFSRCVKL